MTLAEYQQEKRGEWERLKDQQGEEGPELSEADEPALQAAWDRLRQQEMNNGNGS